MEKSRPYDPTHLASMRRCGDPLGDDTVKALFDIGYNPMVKEDYSSFQFNQQTIPGSFPKILSDYFAVLRQETSQFFDNSWEHGQQFFAKYAQELLAMLGFLSLPYCYAAADGAQVLHRSQRIRKSPEKRLLETAAFVFDVSEEGAFSDGGKGIISCGKVRLMHAAIRYHILKSGDWSDDYGTPINQEDMAGTNLAFSLISVRGLRKLGYQIEPEEAWHFISMWNNIGRLLGVDPSLLPNNAREAYHQDKAIARRNFRKSEEGVALTRALHEYMQGSFANSSSIDPASITAYLVGGEVAEILDIQEGRSLSLVAKGLSGLNAMQSFLRRDGSQRLDQAKKMYQQQISGKALEPFRLLNDLTD